VVAVALCQSGLRETVSTQLETQGQKIDRMKMASARLEEEVVGFQRAAMASDWAATQAKADAERAEEGRREAQHRAKIATDRLAKGGGGGPAGGGGAAISPVAVAHTNTAWNAATQRPGQSPGRLEEAVRELQAAISGRRAAEEEALEAATRAARAEGRYEDVPGYTPCVPLSCRCCCRCCRRRCCC